MNHLLDIVALVIVAACAIYAARALLPKAVVARITGNTPAKSGCGDCSDCGTKSSDKSCH